MATNKPTGSRFYRERTGRSKAINFFITPEQHEKLKTYAAKEETSMQGVFSNFVDSLPDQNKPRRVVRRTK